MIAPLTFSIGEFCEAHRISRAFFYELVKEGKAPRLICLGRRRLISAESAAEWRKRMERESEAKAINDSGPREVAAP